MNLFQRFGLWLFCKIARKYRKSKPPYKNAFNEAGFHLIPADIYANIPSVEELRNAWEYKPGSPPYDDTSVFANQQTRDNMLALLKELVPFGAEFAAPRDGDRENPQGFFWKNNYFMDSDAMSYYALIRRFQPERIVEIGCGYSTLVASRAIEKNGKGELHCIEPYPRAWVPSIKHIKDFKQTPIQELSPDYFNSVLRDGDFLFIDTTHTVKTGSDCLYIYLKLLPKIKPKVFIHAHDIYLPAAMPVEWQLDRNFYWTEQYLLLALLIDNPKFEILYGSHYHQGTNPTDLKALMHNQSDAMGGSFWFRRL
ncbi:MAG: class I SAM-dependent methyltransferase [Planctomycetes bacterium]|nr:class I SAM-dependent methyltransferase [Planctomycetota bacterium]